MKDFQFLVHTYQDHEKLAPCLGQLRKVHQGRITIVSDGDRNPTLCHLAGDYNCELVQGERLFPLANGGAILHRMFCLALVRPTRWTVKIDPDTWVGRPFRIDPPEDGPSGTVQHPIRRSLQGGCMVFPLATVRHFVERQTFLQDKWQDWRSWAVWDGQVATAIQDRIDAGLMSMDWMLATAFCEEGIDIHQHREIRSLWQTYWEPTPEVAVVHPYRW